MLCGIARKHTGDKRQAAALTTPEIRKLVPACGPGLAGLRDRALILIGFAGALRRSELVALQHKHVIWTARGISLRIARSKTSPTGGGHRHFTRPQRRPLPRHPPAPLAERGQGRRRRRVPPGAPLGAGQAATL